MSTRMAIAALLALGLAGCVAPSEEAFVGEAHAAANYAPPITDGGTTRAEIVARLGPPSYEFDGGRLMAYRLMLVDRDGELTEREYQAAAKAWEASSRSLELYDRRAKLAKGGMVWVVGPESEQERPNLMYARAAEYSLVVAVDGRGVVTRHAFRRILP